MADAKLQCTVVEAEDHARFTFAGVVDEDVDFASVPRPKKSLYVLDFAGVTAINSCGTREWIDFARSLDGNVRLHYENCTLPIVRQLNLVAGFLRDGAAVLSFDAPYFCAACDKDHVVRLSASQVADGKAPKIPCPACQEPMELDALERQYLGFIRTSA